MRRCDFNKVDKQHFIEITLRHGCSPVDLLHIFRTLFPKNTSGRLVLDMVEFKSLQVNVPFLYSLVFTLPEKSPNKEFFLALIFPYLD